MKPGEGWGRLGAEPEHQRLGRLNPGERWIKRAQARLNKELDKKLESNQGCPWKDSRAGVILGGSELTLVLGITVVVVQRCS